MEKLLKMQKFVIVTIFLTLVALSSAKIFGREEVRRILQQNRMPGNIDIWLCIIEHESTFNSAAINPNNAYFGLFQIGQRYWCSPPGQGCGIPCSKLVDDDIRDDIACAKIIFAEGGYRRWDTYDMYCH